MKAVQQFNSLHNKKVTRQKIERVIALAKKENQTAIIYRLSQLLALKKEESFKVKILKHPIANFLTGTMHTGSYKTALDNCGRLRPGYKFENGTVVKVGAKKVATPKPIVIQKKVVVKHNPSVSKSTLKKSKKAVAIVKKVIAPKPVVIPKKVTVKPILSAKIVRKAPVKKPIKVDPKTRQIALFSPKKPKQLNGSFETNIDKNSLAYRRQTLNTLDREYYLIPNRDIANFIGKVEKKSKESVAITITGSQGSMKTRLCFQLMNCFAQNYKVGHASIEEHPESGLYEDKVVQYLNDKAQSNISAPEINSIDDVHKLVRENDVIFIDSFSKLQEMQSGCGLDKDFRKAYDGKLFFIIYQQTTDGKMRGGSKSQYDGDAVWFIQKENDYKNNYCYQDKNRYQKQNLHELKFNIFSGKLVTNETAPEEVKTIANPIDHNFNFNASII